MATTDLHSAYRPYNPQDYVAYQPPPPPPGPPPNSAATPSGLPPPPTGGHRPDADHVSKSSSSSVNIMRSFVDRVGGRFVRLGLVRRRLGSLLYETRFLQLLS